jgi:hypothetical protein
MPDVLANIIDVITAAGALGTAAMGLVDASKVFCGGPSNFGFGFIARAIKRFVPDTADGPAAYRQADILRTLRASWLNGVASGDQKAKAKALIHLRLTKGDAGHLAGLAGVDAALLASAADKATRGETVSREEIAVLGQFDAVLSAVLDEAYERADQKYRNAAKLLAVLVATVLALFGGPFVGVDWWGSLLVGLVSAPLAPVAKDLATALQNAVSAVRAVKA